MPWRSSVAVATLAALALALAPLGAAGDDRPKTQVKIKKVKPSGASGTVRSPDDACERGRLVRFFRLDDFISVKVQFTRSNANGNWRIERDLEPGRYFAKVDRAKGCRYDTSNIRSLR